MGIDNSQDIIRNAILRHAEVVEESLEAIIPEIEQGARFLLDAVKANNRVLICGNGGSAADAQHFAGEWVCRYKEDRRPLPAIALTVDTSAITAIGNDYGFEQIFSRQVEALGNRGDVLVAITTSGESKNILNAIKAAKKKGLKIIALTGERGRDLKNFADLVVVVPSDETARVQEIHELIIHAWCEFVDASLSR